MINFSQGKQKIVKNSSNKCLEKDISNHKYHGSSINIRQSTDQKNCQDKNYNASLLQTQYNKTSIKNIFKDHYDPLINALDLIKKNSNPSLSQKNQKNMHKKKSMIKVEDQQNKMDNEVEKENMWKIRQKTIINNHNRPFQQSNRYLQTDRYHQDCLKISVDRSPLKSQPKKVVKTEHFDVSEQKSKRQGKIKQSNSIIISVSQLKAILALQKESQDQIQSLEKELKFYKKHFHHELVKNSVLKALK